MKLLLGLEGDHCTGVWLPGGDPQVPTQVRRGYKQIPLHASLRFGERVHRTLPVTQTM